MWKKEKHPTATEIRITCAYMRMARNFKEIRLEKEKKEKKRKMKCETYQRNSKMNERMERSARQGK